MVLLQQPLFLCCSCLSASLFASAGGSYDKENYAVLFVDMRRSTQRAQTVGAEKTFLTMHVFLTALLEVVKHYNGKVIDIMGDGLMVFWGGQAAREENNMVKTLAGLSGIQHAPV